VCGAQTRSGFASLLSKNPVPTRVAHRGEISLKWNIHRRQSTLTLFVGLILVVIHTAEKKLSASFQDSYRVSIVLMLCVKENTPQFGGCDTSVVRSRYLESICLLACCCG